MGIRPSNLLSSEQQSTSPSIITPVSSSDNRRFWHCGPEGAILYPDGSCYYGPIDSITKQRNGFGILITTEGHQIEGVYVNDNLEGKCGVIDAAGNRFIAVYEQGKQINGLTCESSPIVASRMIQSISATTTGDDIVAQPPSSSSSEITATPREVHQWLSDLNMTQYEDRFHVGDVENFREKLKSSSSIPFGHRARLLSNVGKLPSYHSLSTPPQPPTPVTPSSSSVYLPRPPSRAETWLIPPHQLQLQTRIDSNQCCCRCSFLYRGNWLGKDVVIRIYHNVKMSSQCMELLSRIARIRHPNIALFMAAAFSKADEKLFIVTESVTHGSIEQYGNPPIGKRTTNERLKTLTSQNILHISKGIAVACAYLRCQGFSHKNLKPSNVLIDSSLEVKVADYYIMEFNNLFHPLPCEKNFAVAYLSPEALRRTPFIPYGIDSVSDIHSFGMILWELVAGRKPYCGLSRAHIRILVGYGGYRESRPNSHALHGLSRLIRKCTYQDPSQRMTFEQLLISLDTMNRTANSAAEDALITFISGR